MPRRAKPRKSGQASKRWRAVAKSRGMKVGDRILLHPSDKRRKPISMIVAGVF